MSPSDDIAIPAQLKDVWGRLSPLGKGGQGVALLIKNRGTGEQCVLKKLRLDRSNQYARDRMKREIDALIALKGAPNIIEILDHDSNEHLWYTMPRGVDLKKFWSDLREKEGRSVLFERSASIIRDVINGLAAAHERSWIHRDIKPANILIVDGVAKVADFGIVHIPSEARITEAPAQNSFAPHIPSLYDPSVAPKFMDCLAVSNLWAWMLAEDSRAAFGRYHWRWHRFIDDPRCELARAVMARCSNEELGPPDASTLRHLFEEELRLSSMTDVSRDESAAAKILEAQQRKRGSEIIEEARVQEIVASHVNNISSVVQLCLRHCSEVVQGLVQLGVIVKVMVPGHTHGDNSITAADIAQTVSRAQARPGRSQPFFEVFMGEVRQPPVSVALCAHWLRRPTELGTRLALHTRVRRPALGDHNPFERYYYVLPGGRLAHLDDERSARPEEVVSGLLNIVKMPEMYEA